MRVSVAVATFNGAPFLREQLGSLAAQTLAPCELIACDDGSSDGTLEILEAFSRSAPFPVRIFANEERLHFRANFMLAANHCAGDAIAFCDQDDIWRADKLSRVAAAFAADEDVLLVHHNARIFSAARGVSGSLVDLQKPSGVDPPLSRTPFDLPPGFTQSFKRSLLALSALREATLDYWAPGDALAHDQWIYLLAGSLGKVAYLADELVDYRQHGTNLYGSRLQQRSIFRTLTECLTEYRDYGHLALAFSNFSRALAAAAAYPIGDVLAARAAEAARRYDELSHAYEHRCRVYASGSPRERATAWMRLCREGRYRSGGPFHFANHACIHDFLQGVCRGRLRHLPAGLSANDRSLRLARQTDQL